MSDHSEHVTVTTARLYDCLEGECDHVDEDGEPDDMSLCPTLTLEVCVDCMDGIEDRGRDPERWDDVELHEWPHPEPHVSEAADHG